MHSPALPHVKYRALFYHDLEQCKIGGIWQENITVERAIKDGLNPVIVRTKCVEMDMFLNDDVNSILHVQ